jgi:hypothetical protein
MSSVGGGVEGDDKEEKDNHDEIEENFAENPEGERFFSRRKKGHPVVEKNRKKLEEAGRSDDFDLLESSDDSGTENFSPSKLRKRTIAYSGTLPGQSQLMSRFYQKKQEDGGISPKASKTSKPREYTLSYHISGDRKFSPYVAASASMKPAIHFSMPDPDKIASDTTGNKGKVFLIDLNYLEQQGFLIYDTNDPDVFDRHLKDSGKLTKNLARKGQEIVIYAPDRPIPKEAIIGHYDVVRDVSKEDYRRIKALNEKNDFVVKFYYHLKKSAKYKKDEGYEDPEKSLPIRYRLTFHPNRPGVVGRKIPRPPMHEPTPPLGHASSSSSSSHMLPSSHALERSEHERKRAPRRPQYTPPLMISSGLPSMPPVTQRRTRENHDSFGNLLYVPRGLTPSKLSDFEAYNDAFGGPLYQLKSVAPVYPIPPSAYTAATVEGSAKLFLDKQDIPLPTSHDPNEMVDLAFRHGWRPPSAMYAENSPKKATSSSSDLVSRFVSVGEAYEVTPHQGVSTSHSSSSSSSIRTPSSAPTPYLPSEGAHPTSPPPSDPSTLPSSLALPSPEPPPSRAKRPPAPHRW